MDTKEPKASVQSRDTTVYIIAGSVVLGLVVIAVWFFFVRDDAVPPMHNDDVGNSDEQALGAAPYNDDVGNSDEQTLGAPYNDDAAQESQNAPHSDDVVGTSNSLSRESSLSVVGDACAGCDDTDEEADCKWMQNHKGDLVCHKAGCKSKSFALDRTQNNRCVRLGSACSDYHHNGVQGSFEKSTGSFGVCKPVRCLREHFRDPSTVGKEGGDAIKCYRENSLEACDSKNGLYAHWWSRSSSTPRSDGWYYGKCTEVPHQGTKAVCHRCSKTKPGVFMQGRCTWRDSSKKMNSDKCGKPAKQLFGIDEGPIAATWDKIQPNIESF